MHNNKYYKNYLLYKKKYLSLKKGGFFEFVEPDLTENELIIAEMKREFHYHQPNIGLLRDFSNIDFTNPIDLEHYNRIKLEDYNKMIDTINRRSGTEGIRRYNLNLRFFNEFPFEDRENNITHILTDFTGLKFVIWVLYSFSNNDIDRQRSIDILNRFGIINEILEDELRTTRPKTYNYYMRFIKESIVLFSLK
jgi:hypothetical protein